jgi:urease accessory protein
MHVCQPGCLLVDAIAMPVCVSQSNETQEVAHAKRLELRFGADGARTRMFVPVQEPPWRAIRAFQNQQRQAVVHLHNVSGGILSGDSLGLCIEAGMSTRVQVTSVGATRVYRQRPRDATARVCASIRVDSGGMLEYLPDVVIPFAGSRFSQSTTISLGPDAGFIGWETIAAGRVASGEEFGFEFFHSEFSIRSDTRPLALERYSLIPSLKDPRSIARWGRFRYLTTLYICHTGVPQQQWISVESRLNDLAFEEACHATRWGVSSLAAGGLVIRGLALEAHQLTKTLHRLWDVAKQELWGEPAIPPRKIN